MSAHARVAFFTFVSVLALAALLTTIFARQMYIERDARLRAEGRRIALAAVTLYDVLRLTGDEADRATLSSFLRAAVRGTESEQELAAATVVDENGAEVARAENALASKGDRTEVVANVVARDSNDNARSTPLGTVTIELSNAPARDAALNTALVAGFLSLLLALGCAGMLYAILSRGVVKPAQQEAGTLKDALARHVGKELADELVMGGASSRRVKATALYLDVEGFTPLVQQLTPEQAVKLLDALYSVSVEVVHKHGGQVHKLLGDTLVALWTSAEHETRALRAACELSERIRVLAEQRKQAGQLPFSIGIGVASGDVVVGTVGGAERAEAVVVGEPVALAQKIESEAKDKGFGLLVAEQTFRAAQQSFAGAPTPPILIPGVGVPQTLYRVRPRA